MFYFDAYILYTGNMAFHKKSKRSRVNCNKKSRRRKLCKNRKTRSIRRNKKGGAGSTGSREATASFILVNKCPLCSVPREYNPCPVIRTGTRRVRDDLVCPICDEEFDSEEHKCFTCMNCKYKLCKTCIGDINRSTHIVDSGAAAVYTANGVNNNANRGDPIFYTMYDHLNGIQEARGLRHERESIRNYDSQLVVSLSRKANTCIKDALDNIVKDGFNRFYPDLFTLTYELDEETNLYKIDDILMTPEHIRTTIIDNMKKYNEFLIAHIFGPPVLGIEPRQIPDKDDIVHYHMYITQAKFLIYTDHELAQKLDIIINMMFQIMVDNYILELCVPKLLYVHLKRSHRRKRDKTINEYIQHIQGVDNAINKIFIGPLRVMVSHFVYGNINHTLQLTEGQILSIRHELIQRLDLIVRTFSELSYAMIDMKKISIDEYTDVYIKAASKYNHAVHGIGQIETWFETYHNTVNLSILRLTEV